MSTIKHKKHLSNLLVVSGHYDPGLTGEDKDDRPAAHVIGNIITCNLQCNVTVVILCST